MFDGKVVIVTGGGKATLKDASAGSIGYGNTMDQLDLAIYSGLYATFLYMQKAYPHLKETKGSVVNFTSGA